MKRGLERCSWYIRNIEKTLSRVSSVQSLSRVHSLWLHELQHARPPCPSPAPEVYSNSCPSSRWCHPAISSSVVPFSSCPQSLPASGSFPMSQLFMWGGQSIGVSGLASVLIKNISWQLSQSPPSPPRKKKQSTFQVVLVVRIRLPIQQTKEMWVQSLGRKDPLEEGMATHSSIVAWRITWTEETSRL